MSLLDKSLDVNANKRKCVKKPFTPVNPNVCESLRFGNDSYVYNVYIKLAGSTGTMKNMRICFMCME